MAETIHKTGRTHFDMLLFVSILLVAQLEGQENVTSFSKKESTLVQDVAPFSTNHHYVQLWLWLASFLQGFSWCHKLLCKLTPSYFFWQMGCSLEWHLQLIERIRIPCSFLSLTLMGGGLKSPVLLAGGPSQPRLQG